ncbi:MAG: histidine kinase N-terminal 7TM domain-containing protein [Candidatus Methanofastidiosia archaeon]
MNYEFTILALPAIVAGVFCIAVSFYVFSKNPKSEVNRMHSLLTLAAAIWSIGEGMLYLSAKANSLENVILWNNIEYLGISFVAPLWLHLSLIFPRKKKFSQHKLIFPLLYTYGALFYILRVKTNLMYESLRIENGIPTSSRLPLYWLFVGIAYFLLLLGIVSYLFSYLKEKISLKKKQAVIMILAGILPFSGNIFYNVEVFLGREPPWI